MLMLLDFYILYLVLLLVLHYIWNYIKLILFCLFQNVYFVYCLQTNFRYCWSLWLTVFLYQWHSYAGRAGINHLYIGTSCILQLDSYHWHKSKTVEDSIFCGFSCQYTLHCQKLSKFCHWGMIEIGLLNGYFWNQIDIYRKCYYLKI